MTLREARVRSGLTQESLAELVGVDQATISDLERGRNSNPSWATVAKIAAALKVDPKDIFPVEALEGVNHG
jgi:transcriptional regulator with XRE-family HTH domain